MSQPVQAENNAFKVTLVTKSPDWNGRGDWIAVRFSDPMGREVRVSSIFFDYMTDYDDSRVVWPAHGEVEALKGLKTITPIVEIFGSIGAGDTDIGANVLELALGDIYEAGLLAWESRAYYGN